MKKIVKASLLLAAAASLGVMNVNAKTMTTEDLNNLATIKVGSQEIPENLYIYGKYVYVNSISSADLQDAMDDLLNDVEYGKTYRELFTDKKAALIYKDSSNKWTNAKDNSNLAKSTINIEMTHLIGDLKDEHISNEDIYNDGEYVDKQTLPGGRTAEIFVDEKAPLSIANIKLATGDIELASTLAKEYNTYNASAAKVDFNANKNILTLTENTPLLAYSNTKAGSGSQKWIPILIKTNKPVTKDDEIILNGNIRLVLGTSMINTDTNEYLVWVNESYKGTDKLTIKEQDSEDTQKIEIVYNYRNVVFSNKVAIPEDNSNDVVILTENTGVKVATATIDGEYINIFYTDDKNVKKVEFTVNGDKKVATRTSTGESKLGENKWTITDLLQLNAVEAIATKNASKNSDSLWNKNAVSSIKITEHEKTKDEDYSYIVTINHNKEFKGDSKQVALMLDLSVAGATITDSSFATNSTYGITESTKYVYLLTESEKGQILEFTKDGDSLKVLFEFVDETAELNLSVDPAKAVDVFTGNLDGTTAGANQSFKNNMNRVELTMAESETKGTYDVTIQQIDRENTLEEFEATSTSTYFKTIHKWIAVIVDLGIDPSEDAKALTITRTEGSNSIIGTNKDAKLLGETSDTAFVIWLADINASYKFVSEETNASVTINFAIKEIETKPIKDIEDTDTNKVTAVVIDSKYANEVSYNSATKEFTVNTDTTEFVAKTTIETTVGSEKKTETHQYTYKVLTNSSDAEKCGAGTKTGDKCVVKVQNLELVNAYNIETHKDTNKASIIDKVESIKTSGNEINVIFNKHLDPENDRYCLLLDLGVENKATRTDAIYNNSTKLSAATSYLLENTKVSESVRKNLAIICVNESATSKEEGYSTKLYHQVNSNNSIDYEIVIKSKVELSDDVLTLTEENETVEKVELDTANGLDQTTEIDKFVNQEGLTTEIKDGKVYVHYTREFGEPFVNGNSTSGKWFGILFDLGINPNYLKDSLEYKGNSSYNSYSIEQKDIVGAKRFGSKSDTAFMLWFNADKTNGDFGIKDPETGLPALTIKFEIAPAKVAAAGVNNIDSYSEPLTVTFVLVDDVDRLSVEESNLSERLDSEKKINWTYDQKQYEINQGRLSYELTTDEENAKTIKINNAVKEEIPVNYELNGVDGKWYAIKFDLGKQITIEGHEAGVWYDEEIDYSKGQFILWINVESESLSSKAMTIKDVNSRTEEQLKIELSEK